MAGRCSAPSRRRGHVGRHHEALSAESPLGAFGAAVPGGRHRAGGPGIPDGTSADHVLPGIRSGPAVWPSPRLGGTGQLCLHPHRLLLLDRAGEVPRVLRVDRGADDAHGCGLRAADALGVGLVAHDHEHLPGGRVGDAAVGCPDRVAVARRRPLGLLNHVLTGVGLSQFEGFSWLASNFWTFYLIASAVIIWASTPLACISIYS